MPQPFSPDVATRLIGEMPGSTAQEIVTYGLDRGIIGSTGRYPLAGQGGALVKMYLEHRLPEVYRDETRRPYRYYPKGIGNSQPQATQARPLEAASQSTSFRSTPEQDKILTALIPVGAFSNRTDAIKWILDQGIAAKQDLIQQALETHKQIEHLRKGVKFEDPV